jgi:large subunit ribosomal protein L15
VDLSNLHPAPGSRRPRSRVGRGPGSGNGKTAGRGHKGRGSRSGGNTPPGYEGGQMPLQRRLPKRGFRNPFRREYAIVNLSALTRFAADSVVDPAALAQAGLAGGRGKAAGVKILGKGQLDRKLTVKAHAFSESAKAAIEAQGGSVEVIA